MRIRIDHGLGRDDVFLPPIDPLPPLDINDFFELELFTASKTTFQPFEDIEVQWVIASKDPDHPFEDYEFSLVATGSEARTGLESAGSVTIAPYRNTLIRIRGRRRGGGAGASGTLGDGIALTVDESLCETVEIFQRVFDALVFAELENVTSSTAEIRLRRTLSDPTDPTSVVPMEPTSEWTVQSVRYHFPLEIVINNFFNADFDLDLELRFGVHQDDAGAELEVTVDHESDVDFDTVEDILSLGSSAVVAKTLDKVLPLLFECRTGQIERRVVRTMLSIPGVASRLGSGRLLAVRIVPMGNFTHLAIVICPEREDETGPVFDRPGGVVIG